MLLYLHVPFCRRKCRYCAFYSEPCAPGDDARLTAWADALLGEMRREARALGRPAVSTVFFGGGTPSLLSPALTGRILDEAAALFSLEDGAEISMEANPESMTEEKARGFRAAGVNRVSLGVQALDDGFLAALGRAHDKKAALAAFSALRRAGFANVGFDLMWGLPGQSAANWKAQLAEACALSPEHLSCYGLMLEEGTPLYRERESLPLPSEEEAAAMYEEGGALLEAAGYRQYEISNYAKEGFACRHNQGYWQGKDYLGLGPSAVSCIRNERRSNAADTEAWRLAVLRGERAAAVERLGFTERAEELVMLGLRTAEGLDLAAYRALTGRDFMKDNEGLVAELLRLGMAGREGGRFFLTRRGMLVSSSVMEQCFEHIPAKPEGAA
ncbi:radical SAM family heme chaperone HemW [Mailhella massiliensis]|uniref:Heme chaperone HemW n=1 Tax=Mailhella massiliensis TaxID=1903261 RepID=A0A921AUK5_9BACT|nr:radical SAM family heme chaperone HemW [Mailhella massiliensis]HJD96413.1 radical SAM family heme chaperone HemW [Mailhella massiliensis]